MLSFMSPLKFTMTNIVLCLLLFCVHVILIFAASSESDWINHGGDLFNRRYAYKEQKINIETVPKLSLKWKFYANKDITATPTIYNGTIYFPSWNGNIYAIKQIDGSLVWKQNLEKLTGLNTTGFIINANWTVARATPTVAEDLLIVGIYGPAVVIGLERRTGELVWLTHLDNHPAAVVTMSGTYYNGSYYVGTSSLEEGATIKDCCIFRGSLVKLDAQTGDILWKTHMLPDNNGKIGAYAGAAIWGSSPSIDVYRKHVYIATGNLYSAPKNVLEWTHFQFIHFIQFLQTTTDFQQQLALPKTFSDNLKKKLPGNVTLKGPSGVVWNVGLTARDDTIYFTNGWQRFVKDHSLKENDFLVFKYNGESLFEVLIFHGDSFCEKAASYFVGKCGQAHTEQVCNKGKSSNNSVEEVSTPSNGSVECSLPEKSWEEDIYWTHFQFIHFTQLLPEDFEQQLALPKTFSDNLNKKLPENVTLKGPGGVAWKIGLITRDDTVYFLNGWQRFVNDHSLKDNDFLVFNYNGESHFDVLIFDGESFCEKEASYFVGKCSHTQTELGGSKANETNNSIEEVNTASSDGGVECGLYEKFQDLNNIGTPLAVPVETTNEKTFNAGVESDSPELLIADTVTKTTAIQFPYQPTGKRNKRRRSSTSANCCWRALDRVAYNKQHSVTIAVPSQTTGQKTKKPVNEVMPGRSKKRGRQAKTATSGERSIDWVACNKENSEAANLNRSGKADGHDILSGASLSKLSPHAEKEIAQSFTSSFPYFVKIMKTFNVERPRILNIPYEFSKDHLPNCKIKITLHNLKGEQWTVNSVPRTRLHASHILCGGWLNFVRGNSLKIGDVCIFELIGECELRVRINEVGKDGLDSQVGKLACGLDVASHKTSRFMPKKHKISSKCCAEVDLLDKKLSEICQEAALSSELKKSGRASNTSKKAGLSPKSKASHKKPAVPRKHRVEDALSSQANDSLKMLFALDEQRVAEAFTSPFPYFVKIMKKFNVCGSYTLKIPCQFSTAHLPARNTEVTLRNSRGKCWTVNSVPYVQGETTIHTFCGGWNAFVRNNDINFGDTCIFELVSDYIMQVRISGVGKEGLDHQNGNVTLTS